MVASDFVGFTGETPVPLAVERSASVAVNLTGWKPVLLCKTLVWLRGLRPTSGTLTGWKPVPLLIPARREKPVLLLWD